MGDFEDRLKEQEMQYQAAEAKLNADYENSNALTDPREGPVIQTTDYEETSYKTPRKGNLKKFIYFAGVVIVILLLVTLGVKSGLFAPKKISEKQLIVGASFTMEENKSLKVEVGEEDHEIQVERVGDGWAEIVVRSDPLKFRLSVNEVIEIDLDDDGQAELRVKLFRIDENGNAVVAVKRIDKEACKEDWNCGSWEGCFEGKRTRDCTDRNSCGSEFFIPLHEQTCVGDTPVERSDDNTKVVRTIYKNTTVTNRTVYLNRSQALIQNMTNTYNYTQNNSFYSNENETNQTNVGVNPCDDYHYPCYESRGYFCKKDVTMIKVPVTTNIDSSINTYEHVACCPSECVKFISEEQFCDVKERRLFTENETHVCISDSVDFFNGQTMRCCAVIAEKENVNGDVPGTEGIVSESNYMKFVPDKLNYETDEEFSLPYIVYQPQENYYALEYSYEKGSIKKISGRTIFFVQSSDMASSLNSFIERDGIWEQSVKFYDSGIYVYEVELYKCYEIDHYFNTEGCGQQGTYIYDLQNKVSEKLEPLDRIYLEITVLGDSLDFECSQEAPCTDECLNCIEEHKLCINHECVDCTYNSMCKEGYVCNDDYICVSETTNSGTY